MYWRRSAIGKIKGTPNSMACSCEEMTMATRATAIEDVRTGEVTQGVYEHPFVVRLCHWVNAVSLFVMVGSGFQIFRAFPSFGAKIPQKDLLDSPKALALGGWLGGALQWHLTFIWIYIATGLVYIGYQIFSGNYKQVSLHDVTSLVCGRWCGTTSSSAPSH